MDNKKTLQFQLDIDSSATERKLDRTVEAMTRKLKALQAESTMGQLGGQTAQRLQAAGLTPPPPPKAQMQEQQKIQEFAQIKDVFQKLLTQLQQNQNGAGDQGGIKSALASMPKTADPKKIEAFQKAHSAYSDAARDPAKQKEALKALESNFNQILGPAPGASSAAKGFQESFKEFKSGSSASKSQISTPAQEAFEKSSQPERRDLDKFIKQEFIEQEKIAGELTKRLRILKELKEVQAGMVKGTKEELDLNTKIEAMGSNTDKELKEYQGRDKVLNEALDIRSKSPFATKGLLQDGAPGASGGGPSGPNNRQGNEPDETPAPKGSVLKNASAAIGSLATILAAGAELYKDTYQSEQKMNMATGSAIHNTAGKELEAMYSGRGPLEASYIPEKYKAMSKAREMSKGDRADDYAMVGAGVAGLGAAAGAAATGVGLLPSLGIAAAGGLAIGQSDRTRSLARHGLYSGTSVLLKGPRRETNSVTDWFDASSKQADSEYEAHILAAQAENYQKNMAAGKQATPQQTLAKEKYQGSFLRDLDFQRKMGLNRDSFHGVGGFKSKIEDAGFSDEMGMASSSAILSAGGSTRMARDSASALKMERGSNLTNASQVLGTLSGSLGSAESSRQTAVKILAEGVTKGVNQSDFVEESRKLTQITADVISKTGTRSEPDIEKAIQNFNKFVAQPTMKGIEGAKTAYELNQGNISETTGPRGVIRAAGIMKDPVLGKLSGITQMALGGMRDDQVSEDHPVIQNAAEEAGSTPKEVVKRLHATNASATNRRKESDDQISKLKEMRRRYGAGAFPVANIGPVPEDLGKAYHKASTLEGVESPSLLRDRPALESTVMGLSDPNEGGISKSIQDEINKKNENPQTGKTEDNSVLVLAEGAKVAADNFRLFRDEIVPTIEAVKRFHESIKSVTDAYAKLPEGMRSSAINEFLKTTQVGYKTPNQSQGERPAKE